MKAIDSALSELETFLQDAATRKPAYLEQAARDLAYSLARIYAGEKKGTANKEVNQINLRSYPCGDDILLA